MVEMSMTNTRRVQATAPDGTVAIRTSKTKIYTHALATYSPKLDGYIILAGTYTVPAKRVRGYNVRSYQTTASQDIVQEGQEESYGIVSFHTSEAAARKAGQAEINAYAKSAVETREVYGVDAATRVTQFRVVEVEVLDEGFAATYEADLAAAYAAFDAKQAAAAAS